MTGDVRIDVDPFHATYLVFLHAVEDRPAPEPAGFARWVRRHWPVATTVTTGSSRPDDILDYGDGSQLRPRSCVASRFSSGTHWGPTRSPGVLLEVRLCSHVEGRFPARSYGRGFQRPNRDAP